MAGSYRFLEFVAHSAPPLVSGVVHYKKTMKTHVEFRSDAFPPYDGEENEINPGRYGKRVADFLVGGLKEKGIHTLDPLPEDWGWVIPVKNDGFNLWIGCGNYDEYPDDGFLCFIEPHQPSIRRWFFWRVDTSPRVEALQDAIDQVLSANTAIREKKWWTYVEFNRPGQRLSNGGS